MDDSIPKIDGGRGESEEEKERQASQKEYESKGQRTTQTLSIHLPYDHELPFVTCELCQI